MKRKNISFPDDLHDWYEEKAKEIGMSTQSYMLFALKNFIDQQKAISTMDTIINKLDELKKEALELQKNREE